MFKKIEICHIGSKYIKYLITRFIIVYYSKVEILNFILLYHNKVNFLIRILFPLKNVEYPAVAFLYGQIIKLCH